MFGMGSSSTIGIGGMSVRECVKLRERERTKEQEARRVAALEAKVARESIKAQANAGDGWAQVASRSKGGSGASTRSSTPLQSSFVSKSIYSALDADGGAKKERLVLRSGVGAGKSLRAKQPAPEVVDNWEDAEEAAEEKEEQLEAGRGQETVTHEDPQGKPEAGAEAESDAPKEDDPAQAEEASSATDVAV
jgi:transcriptional repressor NF-X1